MSANPRIVHRRETITALPLYYSGPLLKKHKKEKDFKKYHGELRGATLFLYKHDQEETYTEKLDLEELKSIKFNSPCKKKKPAIFNLTLGTEEVQLKMDNPDTGEVWKGYILAVTEKEIPSKLQLLPGQFIELREVLAQERRRNHSLPLPTLPPRVPFIPSASQMPSTSSSSSASPCPSPPPPNDKPDSGPKLPECFCDVTRQEAEWMLGTHPEYGSMLLRPSTLPNNYAVTLRQVTSRGAVMKNYRVTSTDSGYIIELETPVKVPSLNDVVTYFLEKTQHCLQPYLASLTYDTHIEMSPATKSTSATTSTSKTVPKAQVAPTMRPSTNKELQPPTKADQEENEYLDPDTPILRR